MKLITSKNLAWGAIIALLSCIVMVHPAQAGYGGGCCGAVTFNPYGAPIANFYGYNQSQPIYSQPPVIIQSQPIVQQQPIVVQQPVLVQQPVVYQQPIAYNPPVYTPPPTYYPLSVSCSANTSYSQVGQTVTWTAYVSGSNGYYSYTWTGSDGLYGSGQNAYISYNTPGTKYASVTVYSNGQTYTQNCSTSVVVQAYYPPTPPVVVQQPTFIQPIIAVPTTPRLDVGCYVDPTKARLNQPTTWTAEVTGGIGPYTYVWTGSDGLSGYGSSVTKYYSTPGYKSAVVTVTSADGLTATHACSNTLSVASPYHAVARPPAQVPAPAPQMVATSTGMSAASILSLGNVPWGWIAVIVILVLFFAIIYLLFNRQKI